MKYEMAANAVVDITRMETPTQSHFHSVLLMPQTKLAQGLFFKLFEVTLHLFSAKLRYTNLLALQEKLTTNFSGRRARKIGDLCARGYFTLPTRV